MENIKKIPVSLPGVFILEPRVFSDDRGFFFESYNQQAMAEAGIQERFVQDNHSCSHRNVLRGLHYQIKRAQGKLVRVAEGEVLDVAVDLRRSSPSFGRWEAVRLSGDNRQGTCAVQSHRLLRTGIRTYTCLERFRSENKLGIAGRSSSLSEGPARRCLSPRGDLRLAVGNS